MEVAPVHADWPSWRGLFLALSQLDRIKTVIRASPAGAPRVPGMPAPLSRSSCMSISLGGNRTFKVLVQVLIGSCREICFTTPLRASSEVNNTGECTSLPRRLSAPLFCALAKLGEGPFL